jgi:replicative superfamily II helicase
MQMVGRAGRPQFDTEGTAVIMTQRETAVRYQNLLNGAEVVESGLKVSRAGEGPFMQPCRQCCDCAAFAL